MKRIAADGKAEVEYLQGLKARQTETDAAVLATVRTILEDVKQRGDAALSEYTERFDGLSGPPRFLEREAMEAAQGRIEPALLQAMGRACENIRRFHERQLPQGFVQYAPDGSYLGQMVRGLARVGLYVPGGRAAYPSSVLMNAIPAKIAGVEELIVATPPGADGRPPDVILAAAALAGVDRILLCGGAQACAALAYGTESVPAVDKITGPGNIYVATAKQLLYGVCDIDMVAGPSEILIVADEKAPAAWVAADLLSQCEHDPDAAAILVTPSAALADAVEMALAEQVAAGPRKEIMQASLAAHGAIIVVHSLAEAMAYANAVAPEHLELMVAEADRWLGAVKNAGSVFLGNYTPEPVGDYFAGPNHVLPTSGTARFFSPLGVESFLKRTQFSSYSQEALARDAADVIAFAEAEGLYAHAAAVKVRMSCE